MMTSIMKVGCQSKCIPLCTRVSPLLLISGPTRNKTTYLATCAYQTKKIQKIDTFSQDLTTDQTKTSPIMGMERWNLVEQIQEIDKELRPISVLDGFFHVETKQRWS